LASRRAVCKLPAVFLLAGCHFARPNLLKHDAYIWQRVWTDELKHEIQQQAALFNELRCFTAQRDVKGNWLYPAIDVAFVKSLASVNWVWVIRIDGAQPDIEVSELQREINLLRAILGEGAQIELDFDCASAQLSGYTKLLAALKQSGESIRITALPSWHGSAALPALLAHCDHLTLQVHAVENPKPGSANGLFDPERALQWLKDFDAICPCALSVALPTYGAVRYTDSSGKSIIRHESEFTPREALGEQFMPDARVLQRFLVTLDANKWRKLLRVVWFRLTLSSDRFALAPASVAALVQKLPLNAVINSFRRANKVGGFDVFLRNDGNCAGPAPIVIAAADACAGEALAGYNFQGIGDNPRFVQSVPIEIKPGQTLAVGWIRACD